MRRAESWLPDVIPVDLAEYLKANTNVRNVVRDEYLKRLEMMKGTGLPGTERARRTRAYRKAQRETTMIINAVAFGYAMRQRQSEIGSEALMAEFFGAGTPEVKS